MGSPARTEPEAEEHGAARHPAVVATSARIPSTAIKIAVAVLGVLPIMIVYPFFQRFFVKGITVGAVKG